MSEHSPSGSHLKLSELWLGVRFPAAVPMGHQMIRSKVRPLCRVSRPRHHFYRHKEIVLGPLLQA